MKNRIIISLCRIFQGRAMVWIFVYRYMQVLKWRTTLVLWAWAIISIIFVYTFVIQLKKWHFQSCGKSMTMAVFLARFSNLFSNTIRFKYLTCGSPWSSLSSFLSLSRLSFSEHKFRKEHAVKINRFADIYILSIAVRFAQIVYQDYVTQEFIDFYSHDQQLPKHG